MPTSHLTHSSPFGLPRLVVQMYLDAKKDRAAAACLSDWLDGGPMGALKADEWVDPKDEALEAAVQQDAKGQQQPTFSGSKEVGLSPGTVLCCLPLNCEIVPVKSGRRWGCV